MITGDKYFRRGFWAWHEARRDNLMRNTAGAKLYAEINHGRWIVRCPWCSGAEMAFEEGLFRCDNCKNAAIQGAVAVAVFPAQLIAIEKLLQVRPRENRNWLPGETVSKLRAENIEHGLEAV